MAKRLKSDVFCAHCPSREILKRLADKWTVLLIIALMGGPKHFGCLKRTIAGISQKSLTQVLRNLERDGILSRKVLPTRPPRVEYALTRMGLTLFDVMELVQKWSEAHVEEVILAQKKFDESSVEQKKVRTK